MTETAMRWSGFILIIGAALLGVAMVPIFANPDYCYRGSSQATGVGSKQWSRRASRTRPPGYRLSAVREEI